MPVAPPRFAAFVCAVPAGRRARSGPRALSRPPVQSLAAAAAGAPSLAPLPSCRRERALPASAVNGGDGGGGVGGGWGTRFPRSKHCSETVAEKIKVSSLFLSSPVPFLPHTQSFVSIQEKFGESPN